MVTQSSAIERMLELIFSWEFVPNLAAEAIGVFVEICLIYFIINRILEHRERERWLPARERIAKLAMDTYQSIVMYAVLGMPDQHDRKETERLLAAADYVLRRFKRQFDELSRAVDLNAQGLGSDMMPQLDILIEQARIASDKIVFFQRLYDADYRDFDIVGDPPLEHVQKLEHVYDFLCEMFPSVQPSQKVVPMDQIERAWSKAGRNNTRLVLSFEELDKGRPALVYSGEDARTHSMPTVVRTFRP